MDFELETHNVSPPVNFEYLNSGYTEEGVSKLKQISFDFLTQPSSQDESTRELLSFDDETHAVTDSFNRMQLKDTVYALVSSNKSDQIVNIFEDSAPSSNAELLKTTCSNSAFAEEQKRRDQANEPFNLPMELEAEIDYVAPVLQGEISTQTAANVPKTVDTPQRSGRARRGVKSSKEEEIMKNDLNNLQQEFSSLKLQKNVRTTKIITKKKLEDKDEKFNRLSGFRNHISLVGKAVQTFAETYQEFRRQLRLRLEGVELSAVANYLTEEIKGRKNAKDQSKLANKKDVTNLLKVRSPNDPQANQKRGAMAAFELFLDGEFYNTWLNAHYEKKWEAQGQKGRNQRDAFIHLKEEVRKSFLDI